MDYGKEIQFSTMSKWIMERIRGFNSGVLGFKGFIMEKGKRNGKRKKLWKRMPTLGRVLQVFNLEHDSEIRWNAESFTVWQSEQLVVIQH